MLTKNRRLGVLAGAAFALSCAAPSVVVAADQQYGSQAAAPAQPGMAGGAQASGPLMNLTVSELQGKTIVNNQGQELGQIENIVKDRQTNQMHAVIGVGGFLGIGQKQVTLPIEQLSLSGEDQLVAATDASSEELQQRVAYDEQAYDEVQDDMSLAEAAAPAGAAGTTGELAAFEQLDRDGDGVISRDEAQAADSALVENWQSADSNADDRIDESEFSAFESRLQEAPQEGAPGSPTMSPGAAGDAGMPGEPAAPGSEGGMAPEGGGTPSPQGATQ